MSARFVRIRRATTGREPYGTEAAIQRRVRPLLLLSVLIATFVVPAVLARRPAATFRHVLALFAACVAVYVFLVIVVYPRLS
jgi:hypothetical protein